MTNQELTRNLKLIVGALGLINRYAIAEIVTLGGVKMSASRADSILRSATATKNVTGKNAPPDQRINRSATITPEEFHAFCIGLKPYLDSLTDDA